MGNGRSLRLTLPILGIIAVAILLSTFVFRPVARHATNAFFEAVGRYAETHKNVPPRPARFVYRVSAEVKFDGQPYTIDEWVGCDTVLKTWGAWPRGGYMWSLTPTVESLGVRTADGGALFIKVPRHMCGMAAKRMKELADGEAGTAPLSELSAAPDYLPEFYWFDDADAPTRAEAYLSDLYYRRADRRLTIERVAIGSVASEPPAGAEVVDIQKAFPDPFNTCELERSYAKDLVRDNVRCFSAYGAYPIAEEEWRLSPELAEFLQGLPDDRLTSVPVEVMREHPLDSKAVRKQLGHGTTLGAQSEVRRYYGVGSGMARLERDADGRCLGLLQGGQNRICENYRLFETVVPIDCEGDECRLIENGPGVFFFRYYPRPFPDRTLDVHGTTIPLPNGEIAGWYDPSTRILWWVTASIGL